MSVSDLDVQTITLAATLVFVQTSIGLLLAVKAFWKFKVGIVFVQALISGLLTGLFIAGAPLYMGVVFMIVQAYLIFHVLRFMQKRADRQSLVPRVWRTQLILGIWSMAVIGLWIAQNYSETILGWFVLAQLAIAIWLLVHAIRSYKQTQPSSVQEHLSDGELPTLTVAIPARNETMELNAALEALLRNDYPKLEILVLDDCSQDNTSDIIRSFAHRGVRFLKGLEVDDKWLAKNHAYDQLIDNASGQYILFCGVDVRFGEQSLRLLVSEMLESKLEMICVLPLRPLELSRDFLMQPMRYWRELAIPRIHKTTPPSLSTCWAAKRQSLQKLGGFEGLRRTIRPERFIARSFAIKGQYKFVRSSKELAISSVKSLPAQWQTALRTRYPELKSRPENVLFTTAWQLALLLGPFFGIVYGLIALEPLVLAICFASTLMLGAVHGLVTYMTTNEIRIEAIALLPISIAMELAVLNYSMWAYEYSQVIWKGRNICLPVMRVHARLPKL